MGKIRDITFDIAKGIGIVLVVIGHYIPDNAPSWYIGFVSFVYHFHMPLFFMLSGYCFNIAKHPQLLPFAVSRVWTLLVPCVLYTVVSLVVSPEYICEGRYYELKTLLPGALWFLPILFIVEVLGYNVARFRGGKNICHIAMRGLGCLLSFSGIPFNI